MAMNKLKISIYHENTSLILTLNFSILGYSALI